MAAKPWRPALWARYKALVPVCVLTAAALCGCATRSATGGASSGNTGRALTLGMVTDAGLGSPAFGRSARHGLMWAQTRLGAKITIVRSHSASEYQPNLTALVNRGERMIFAVGYLMRGDLAAVARRFPGQRFAIVDGVVNEPNVVSVTFKEQDGAFMVGALAGLATKTNSVAFLGGMDLPSIQMLEAGFSAGVCQTNPNARVFVEYAGSFDDAATGKQLAGTLYARGADIIFAAAGKTARGAIDEVKRRPAGDYVIGVDSDQDALAPGRVLTSLVKHVDVAILDIAKQVEDGGDPSGHVVLGLADDGVGMTGMKYTAGILTPRDREELAAIRGAVVAGKIVPPSTREQLRSFTPLPLGRRPVRSDARLCNGAPAPIPIAGGVATKGPSPSLR
ncbi:MAG: BMP family ABC transporter substrate-binding protein [bacterium]|nr:BMP family ABC transporter substrate-binding protein [bacterium]